MRHFQPKLPLALLSAGLLVLSACGDSATEPDDHDDDDDHAEEVEGVTLTLSGQTIATYDGDDGAWTGELEVEPGEETAHISVQFVDHNGQAVALDNDYYLEVEVEDESVAEFEQDTPGEFGGHLHGGMEGDTEITFSLMHGAVGSGHADFVTAPLHVHVHEHDDG
ncbi:hypothetical protein [Candidatus Palauibacter sp.]|uniref:hypothetical protein n=1 Tax=Candidatus Palauibacter sp. TaxID=3101350 RepID=UPI003B51A8A8